MVVVATTTLLLGSRLPWGVELAAPAEDATSPKLVGHPVLLGVQLGAMVAYAAATVGFVRLAERLGDGFTQSLAVAAVTAAFARLNYFLYPSVYSEWVYVGDAFRLLFYLLILLAVFRELGRYWQRLAQAAVGEERRRIARDLHDGVAQELALLVRKGRRLAASDGAVGEEIAAAAERALVESRRALEALTLPPEVGLEEAVASAVRAAAERNGGGVVLELETATVPALAHDAFVRIASEAVTNAARHARAANVRVRLSNGDGVRLEIEDDGVGFNAAWPSAGFGLVGMRERAESVGARFRCVSRPGAGTLVEVVLP
jgi:signal transduction histidine kinase